MGWVRGPSSLPISVFEISLRFRTAGVGKAVQMEDSISTGVSSGCPHVHLVVDDREVRSAVYLRLAALADVHLEIRHLTAGDYEVENEWIFERKTVQDFALSVVDGRLFSQARRLARCPAGRALIVEGKETENSCVSREAWQGAMVSLGLAFQLPVLRSENAEETVRLLRFAAQQARRQRETVFVPARRRPRTLERQRILVLAGLPGVGAHRARLLLDYFGSIEAVMLADETELNLVPGIGPHTARQIRRVVKAGPHEAWSAERSG